MQFRNSSTTSIKKYFWKIYFSLWQEVRKNVCKRKIYLCIICVQAGEMWRFRSICWPSTRHRTIYIYEDVCCNKCRFRDCFVTIYLTMAESIHCVACFSEFLWGDRVARICAYDALIVSSASVYVTIKYPKAKHHNIIYA